MAIPVTSAGTNITLRVLAFARMRELLGYAQRSVEVPAGCDVAALWRILAAASPEAASMRDAIRIARNGVLAGDADPLAHGDEIALLPPVSGG